MIYGKDHAIRKNTKAHVDVVEEVKRIEWISTRKLNMRDDVDDSVSFSLASSKHPKL